MKYLPQFGLSTADKLYESVTTNYDSFRFYFARKKGTSPEKVSEEKKFFIEKTMTHFSRILRHYENGPFVSGWENSRGQEASFRWAVGKKSVLHFYLNLKRAVGGSGFPQAVEEARRSDNPDAHLAVHGADCTTPGRPAASESRPDSTALFRFKSTEGLTNTLLLRGSFPEEQGKNSYGTQTGLPVRDKQRAVLKLNGVQIFSGNFSGKGLETFSIPAGLFHDAEHGGVNVLELEWPDARSETDRPWPLVRTRPGKENRPALAFKFESLEIQ